MAHQTRVFSSGRAHHKPTCLTACYRISAVFIVLLTFGIGIALTLIFWHVVDDQQRVNVNGVFQREATNRTSAVLLESARIRDFLVDLGSAYLVAGYQLDPTQFDLFCMPFINRSGDTRSVAYSPLVTLEYRPAFEQMLSLEENTTTVIMQLTPSYMLELASPRPLYLPISILFPVSGNSTKLIGFDLWSAGFENATAQAAASRLVTCSSRTQLSNSSRTDIVMLHTSSLDPTNEQYATLFTLPIYLSQTAPLLPTGFVSAFTALPVLVCSVIDCSDPSLEVFIFDKSAPPTEQYLFQLVRSSLSLSLSCAVYHRIDSHLRVTPSRSLV